MKDDLDKKIVHLSALCETYMLYKKQKQPCKGLQGAILNMCVEILKGGKDDLFRRT